MALNSNALCTVAQVKDYAGLTDTHKDESVELYVNAASNLIDEYLGYSPLSDTYADEYYDGNGTHFLTTKARPITSLTSVECDGDTVDIDDFVTRDWYIDGVDYVFIRGRSNYTVSYVAGHATTPSSIELACVKIAALMLKEDGRTGSLGTSSVSHGDGSRTFLETSYDSVFESISTYRRLDG